MSVYLVGAGPGDEGLITVRGLDLIRSADVIVYDNLADRGLLREARADARLIFAGKKAGCHSMRQPEINMLLVEEGRKAALAGQVVVRLKGGDPFLFGRGAEEMEALLEAGLSFEVVPGVSSALAVPAYAGIPLTHRDFSSSVTIASGHSAPGNPSLDWGRLAQGADTLVVLMGLANLEEITGKILDSGVPLNTPAAVVEWGSTGRQRKVTASLGNIAARVRAEQIKAPAIFVLGKMAQFGAGPSWFERKPLFGRTIVVTRARKQAGKLVLALKGLGADVIEFPTIEIRPFSGPEAGGEVISNLSSYSWLVFTSANGVDAFFEILNSRGLDSRALGGLRLAAIGPGTALALSRQGLSPDFIPEEFVAESLAEGLLRRFAPGGGPVLVARAKEARPALENNLEKQGVPLHVFPVYETVLPLQDEQAVHNRARVRDALSQNKIDAVLFCSSSAVDNFFKLIEPGEVAGKNAAFVCIGPVTAESLKKYGLSCTVQPETYNLAEMIGALENFFRPAES